jgi:hypothetical protein
MMSKDRKNPKGPTTHDRTFEQNGDSQCLGGPFASDAMQKKRDLFRKMKWRILNQTSLDKSSRFRSIFQSESVVARSEF